MRWRRGYNNGRMDDPAAKLVVTVVFLAMSLAFLAFAIYTVANPSRVAEYFAQRHKGRAQTPSQVRVVGIVFLVVAPLFVFVGMTGLVQAIAG